MSLLRYCKKKGGGEPPSPKRSRLKTIIDGKERDGVVQSDEGEGMLRYPLRKQGKGTPAEILDRKRNVCCLCQIYNKNPFARGIWNTVPCTRFRQQSIIAHEACAAHKDALKLESDKLTSIHNALNPKIPAKGIEQAFISLYFLAKQRIPHTTNSEPLFDLLGLLGVNVKSRIQIARNALYTSDKSVQEMVAVNSEVIEVYFG